MSDAMSNEEWFTIRNELWSRAQQGRIRREMDRLRAAEEALGESMRSRYEEINDLQREVAEKATEIERLRARLEALGLDPSAATPA
jgi:uncharacterized protein YlxW (UPF0749 family)